ncbi:MAG: CoA pyrophosphatase [Bacteroidales bacterium]|nr:CoA pyrophosphatase [Bacteroidales bacterium]
MDRFRKFSTDLKMRLAGTLPGHDAHMMMASVIRKRPDTERHDPSGIRRSAVLILLYPSDGSIYTALTLRQQYPGVHSGQVSFPGGRFEEGDSSLVDTALRETEEEIGIEKKEILIAGTLSELFIPPSNNLVLPVVGLIGQRPMFRADPMEVARIIEADIEELFRDGSVKEKEVSTSSGIYSVPCFEVDGEVVWGATAMILSELKVLLGR